VSYLSHANRQVDAAKTAEILSTTVDMGANERQARALGPVLPPFLGVNRVSTLGDHLPTGGIGGRGFWFLLIPDEGYSCLQG